MRNQGYGGDGRRARGWRPQGLGMPTVIPDWAFLVLLRQETGDPVERRHGVIFLSNSWCVHVLSLEPVRVLGPASLDRQPGTHQVGSPWFPWSPKFTSKPLPGGPTQHGWTAPLLSFKVDQSQCLSHNSHWPFSQHGFCRRRRDSHPSQRMSAVSTWEVTSPGRSSHSSYTFDCFQPTVGCRGDIERLKIKSCVKLKNNGTFYEEYAYIFNFWVN